ncbi:hypothetical protein ACOQNJ_13035 [Acinetobacter baumannii]|uniref:hypothetical protein n=1 Tax=Acinetobacter baumannii TaxID=470 RepID=UPI00233FDB69|nr:hypothetical protein [Acinetobacter baumannii]
MIDLNQELEDFDAYFFKRHGELPLDPSSEEYANKSYLKHEMFKAWKARAKAQAVPDTHLLVEKSKIETWWQDAEEPENFASRIEDMPSLGQYINGNEIMEITEHHTIHLPSKSIYGVWVDKDGDRSFCTGTLEECQALVGRESGAEG